MSSDELVAEIRAAAASLISSATAVDNGDLTAAEIGLEDALFRVQSVLARMKADARSGNAPIKPEND